MSFWPDGKKYGDNIRLNNYLVMRYAEVFELCRGLSPDFGDQGEAKKYINMIQKRAGSKTISETVDMDVGRKKIIHFVDGRLSLVWHHAMEGYKGHWSFDKNAGTVCHICLIRFSRTSRQTDQNVTWEHGQKQTAVSIQTNTPEKGMQVKVGFKKGKHEFFPYPQTVMDKNP